MRVAGHTFLAVLYLSLSHTLTGQIILEIKADGIVDFTGNYEDYLASQGVE